MLNVPSGGLCLTLEFPCEKRVCILSKTPCNFFMARQKDDKVVFIVAPGSMGKITDIVKRVVTEAKYEPFVAVERTEGYGNFAFCQNICEPMLKSSIVVVIGDWSGNQGNVNAAYEFGIAKAMGCEIIPISGEGGPFDLAMLHSIILPSGWKEDPSVLVEFERRVKAAFENKKKEVELRGLLTEIPQSVRDKIDGLMEKFDHPISDRERELPLKLLLRTFRSIRESGYAPYRYERFINWMIRLVEECSNDKIDDGVLRIPFCELLEAVVTENVDDAESMVVKSEPFHGALTKIVLSKKRNAHVKNSALISLQAIGKAAKKPLFFSVATIVVKDLSLDDDKYDQLHIPDRLKQCVADIRSEDPGQLFDFLKTIESQTHPVIARRCEKIHDAVNIR